MNAGEIVARITSHWRLKAVLSLALTGGFTAGYLLLQWRPLFPVGRIRVTWLDRNTPFLPGAVYLYESLWLLMPVGPWLMRSRGDLRRYSLSFLLIALAGFSVFFFFPTSCPRPAPAGEFNPLYRTLIRLDRDLNAFPSLHAALAVFSGACCHRLFAAGRWTRALRWLIWAWVAGIIAATLLTKQHVAIEALVGALLGGACYGLGWRIWKESPDPQ